MNPKQFLIIGGIVLVLVGILGAVGVIGPTADKSIFGEAWVFDVYENWAHLILGIVALVAAFTTGESVQRPLTLAVGVIALFFTVYNLFSVDFLGAMLQRPLDLILHLVVTVWAFVSAKGKATA